MQLRFTHFASGVELSTPLIVTARMVNKLYIVEHWIFPTGFLSFNYLSDVYTGVRNYLNLLWREYALEEDSKLTDGGRALKSQLLTMIEKQTHVIIVKKHDKEIIWSVYTNGKYDERFSDGQNIANVLSILLADGLDHTIRIATGE